MLGRLLVVFNFWFLVSIIWLICWPPPQNQTSMVHVISANSMWANVWVSGMMELPDTRSPLCLFPFGTFSQSLSSIKSSSSGTRTGAGIDVVVVGGVMGTVGGASLADGGGTFLMGACSTTGVALVVLLAVALATSDVGGGGGDGGGDCVSAEMTVIRTMNRRDRVTMLH